MVVFKRLFYSQDLITNNYECINYTSLSKEKAWLVLISYSFKFDLFWSLVFQATCKQGQQHVSREDRKVLLGLCHGCDTSWGMLFFSLPQPRYWLMKGQLRVLNAKSKFIIQKFGQNDKAIKNSIYKAWVNNSILNEIALKAILEKEVNSWKTQKLTDNAFLPSRNSQLLQ